MLAHSAPAQVPAAGPSSAISPTLTPGTPAYSTALSSAFPRPATPAAALAPMELRSTQSTISTAAYTGVIGEKVAQFDGSILLTSASTNQTLPLFGDDVALEDFSVKSGEARLLRSGGRLSVFMPIPAKP